MITVSEDCSGNGGSIAAKVKANASSTGPYEFAWSNGQTTTHTCEGLIENLPSGKYDLTITAADGCQIIEPNMTIESGGVPQISREGTEECVCAGQSTGVLNISVDLPYETIEWTGPDGNYTTEDLSDVPAGAYSVKVTTKGGCEATANFSIQTCEAITINGMVEDATDGIANGRITLIEPIGGNFNYQWSNQATTPNIDNLMSGNYTVTVTNENGCTNDYTFNVGDMTNPSEPFMVSCEKIADDDCSPYKFSIDISGGVPDEQDNYQLTISGPVSESKSVKAGNYTDFVVTETGTYTIEVTDANETKTFTKEIVSDTGEDIMIEVTNTGCPDSENGMIELKIKRYASIEGPYTIEWIDQMQTEMGCKSVLSDLAAGEYCVKVTGADDCVAMTCVMVEAGEEMEVMIDASSNCACAGNEVMLTANVEGGNGEYTYAWSNGDSGASIQASEEDYTVTVMDNGGCEAISGPYSVVSCGEPMQLMVTSFDGGCLGKMEGEITAELTGGTPPFNFELRRGFSPIELIATNTEPSFTNIAPSLYWIIAIDANNCETEVFQPLFPSTVIDVSVEMTNQDCDGIGSRIDITASGGAGNFTYELRQNFSEVVQTSATPLFENVEQGRYSVFAIDENGCEGFESITVNTVPLRFRTRSPFPFNDTNPTGCNGMDGSISFTGTPDAEGGTPPYTFFWEDSSTGRELTSLTGVSAGRYCLKVRDSNGCEDEGPCRELVDEITDPDEMINVDRENIFIKDECEGEFNGRIEVAVIPNNDIVTTYSFDWNITNADITSTNSSSTLDMIRTGNYRVTITDAFTGCSIVEHFFVDELISMGPFVVNEANNDFKPSCPFQATGTATIGLEGGNFPYKVTVKRGDEIIEEDKEYNNSPVVIEGLTQGEYTFEAMDICDRILPEILSFSIGEIPEMNFQVPQNVKNCPGESYIEFNITGGAPPYTYRWSNGVEGASDVGENQRLEGLIDQNYSITVTDNSGCFQDWTEDVDAFAPARPMFENRLVSCPDYVDEIFRGDFNCPGCLNPLERDINTLLDIPNAGIIGEINITGFEGREGDTYIGPVNIIWPPELSIPDNTRRVSGLLPGNYAITITDGCNNFERRNEQIYNIRIAEGDISLDGFRFTESCFEEVLCEGIGTVDNNGTTIETSSESVPINTIWSGYQLSGISIDGNDDCSVELLCNSGSRPAPFVATSNSLGFRTENCNSNGCKEDLECSIAINRTYRESFTDILMQDRLNEFQVIEPTIFEETPVTRNFEVINPSSPKLMGGFCGPREVEVDLSCGNIQNTGCTECLDCDMNNPIDINVDCENEGCGCEVIFDCEGVRGRSQGIIVEEFVDGDNALCTNICHNGFFCKRVTKCRVSSLNQDFIIREKLETVVSFLPVTEGSQTPQRCNDPVADTLWPNSCMVMYGCGDIRNFHSWCDQDCSPFFDSGADFQCREDPLPLGCGVLLPPEITTYEFKNGVPPEQKVEIEILQENKFRVTKVFPNPFRSRINIEVYTSYSGKQQIQLFDVLGRKVQYLEQRMERGKNLINIDIISNLKHGIYYLYIVDEFGNKYSTSVVHSPN